ncbi:hypothetical protein ACC870_37720, partial [Rhizobium ruizarguesonis]
MVDAVPLQLMTGGQAGLATTDDCGAVILFQVLGHGLVLSEDEGFACSSANDQLARIESAAVDFLNDADARVHCKTFIL